MFEGLKRLTHPDTHDGVKFPPKFPFIKRNWTETMQTLEDKIQTLQSRFTTAERVHADACLAALDGNEADMKAREAAHAEFVKVEQELANTRAALHAATRHKEIEDEKKGKKLLAERQKRIAELHKEAYAACSALDTLFDDVAATALVLRDKTRELRLQGIKTAQTPVVNLERALGSRLARSGVKLGEVHPFDSGPLKLVDMCPALIDVVSSLEKKK